jgi:hypothetical protein
VAESASTEPAAAQMIGEPPRDERKRIDHARVLRQKLKLDTVKLKLAMLAPKKHSESFQVAGAEGSPLMPRAQEMTEEHILEGARRTAFVLQQTDQIVRNKPRTKLLRGDAVTY